MRDAQIKLENDSSQLIHKLIHVLFAFCIVFNVILSWLDPGFLKSKDRKTRKYEARLSAYDNANIEEMTDVLEMDSFLQLLASQDPQHICYECQLLKTMRSKHCLDCGKCVDVYDHHCPWINNCVGYKNYKLFFTFITIKTVYVGLLSWEFATYLLFGNWLTDKLYQNKPKYDVKCTKNTSTAQLDCVKNTKSKFKIGMEDVVIFLLLVLALFFFFSLLLLVSVQCTNIATGLTTNERYSSQRAMQQPGADSPADEDTEERDNISNHRITH